MNSESEFAIQNAAHRSVQDIDLQSLTSEVKDDDSADHFVTAVKQCRDATLHTIACHIKSLYISVKRSFDWALSVSIT